MRELVLVHGRAQEHKDSIALKAEWLETWREGLAKSGLELPITNENVHFPFYGGDSVFVDAVETARPRTPPSGVDRGHRVNHA